MRPRDAVMLFLMVVLAAIFGRMQTNARNDGRTDFVSNTVRGLTRPISGLVDGMADGISDFFGGIFSARSLRDKVRRLEQVDRANRLYNEQAMRYQREIDSLRKLINLPAVQGVKREAAEVTGYFPHEGRVTINVGSRQGIKSGMPVVASDGLLGIVQTVDTNFSQVNLISSPRLTVGAMAMRNPPAAGLLKGESPGVLSLEFLDFKAPVQVGDLVVTSGFSDRIKRGIPIGRVVQVEDDDEYGSRRCLVFPNVQIGDVREVFVLK